MLKEVDEITNDVVEDTPVVEDKKTEEIEEATGEEVISENGEGINLKEEE